MQIKKSVDVRDSSDSVVEEKDPGRWRDLTAFWILGVTIGFGDAVLLTAAHDIAKTLDGNHPVSVANETTKTSHGQRPLVGK